MAGNFSGQKLRRERETERSQTKIQFQSNRNESDLIELFVIKWKNKN